MIRVDIKKKNEFFPDGNVRSDYTKILIFRPGLLRTSMSVASWLFEALVLVPKVGADVLVFGHNLRGW